MEKQREKNRFVIDKNQPYEYNIAIIILGESGNEGIRRTNNTFANYSTTFNQLIFCGECTRNLNSVNRNRGGKKR